MKALKVTGQTMVSSGNCFSVEAEKGHYSIVNFCIENLKIAVDKCMVSWPIEITEIGKGVAIIDDIRIPEKLYSERYCPVCCPFGLLPANQQDQIRRNKQRDEYYKGKIRPQWNV